ncbi:T9SS type A sorting domain-containing protein [Hymenobacter lapidiphilus]|uniref:T9SS type A sorting domain-containing protein n=1 Tax=Hymenobacter lapidiphilus TaxID=2608003 RepID=A0A7Y7U6J2_9BACT|nr:T9SS type A sorting domain-containing protein [Hymenobacter lapidiphilus]NVO32881.1 T9SS type A sorting domain-containing protein [Hymenobacter lapidiphilus]
MFRFAYLLVAASLVSQLAAAQWSTSPAQPTPVSAGHGVPFIEQRPLSATLPDGRRYVAWVENQRVVSQPSENVYTVRLQLFGADGRKQWAPAGLPIYTSPTPTNSNLTAPTNIFQGYDLKADAAGNAVLVYSNLNPDGDQGEIRAQKINPAGQTQWGSTGGVVVRGPVPNTPIITRRNARPVLALTSTGDALLAWSPNSSTVALQKLAAASGQSVWPTPPLLADASNTLSYTAPALLTDGAEGAILVFYRYAPAPGTPLNTLLAQHYDGTGAPQWVAPITVSDQPAQSPLFPLRHPLAVADGTGGCYIAFNTPPGFAGTPATGFVQHLDAAGTRWSAAGTAVPTDNPAAARVAALRYVAARQGVWLLLGTDLNDQTSSGVYVQQLDANGTPLLGATATVVVPTGQTRPLAHDLRDTKDGLLVLYSEDVPAAGQNAANQLLRAAKIDYTGRPAWAAGSVLLAEATAPKQYPSLSAYAPTGNVVVVWEELSSAATASSRVLAQGLSSTGQLGASTPLASHTASLNPNVALYPNPSTEAALHLTLGKSTTVYMEVLDLLGRLVASRAAPMAAGTQILPLPAVAAGTYLVRARWAGQTTVLKWTNP